MELREYGGPDDLKRVLWYYGTDREYFYESGNHRRRRHFRNEFRQ